MTTETIVNGVPAECESCAEAMGRIDSAEIEIEKMIDTTYNDVWGNISRPEMFKLGLYAALKILRARR